MQNKCIYTITLLCLLLVATNSEAQPQTGKTGQLDTIRSNELPGNYFYNQWLDTSESAYVAVDNYLGWTSRQSSLTAITYHNKKPIKVIGMAAMLQYRESDTQYCIYKSLDSVYDYFSLLQVNGNKGQIISDSVYVNPALMTPAYYYQLQVPLYVGWLPNPAPVYEIFFDSVIEVKDSFALGFTHTHKIPDDLQYNYDKLPIAVKCFCTNPYYGISVYIHRMRKGWGDWRVTKTADRPFFFPILGDSIPNVDTTVVDTTIVDTAAAISHLNMVSRYVTVSPNPATERVVVRSSFGVERVECFDAAGMLLFDKKVSGLEVTIDISPIPAGVCAFRIHTPMGAVVKKVVVD